MQIAMLDNLFQESPPQASSGSGDGASDFPELLSQVLEGTDESDGGAESGAELLAEAPDDATDESAASSVARPIVDGVLFSDAPAQALGLRHRGTASNSDPGAPRDATTGLAAQQIVAETEDASLQPSRLLDPRVVDAQRGAERPIAPAPSGEAAASDPLKEVDDLTRATERTSLPTDPTRRAAEAASQIASRVDATRENSTPSAAALRDAATATPSGREAAAAAGMALPVAPNGPRNAATSVGDALAPRLADADAAAAAATRPAHEDTSSAARDARASHQSQNAELDASYAESAAAREREASATLRPPMAGVATEVATAPSSESASWVSPLAGGPDGVGNVARPAAALAPAQPVEMIPQQVEMLASRGGGTARIRLDPPELGHIEIKVALRGSTVDVVIRTEESAAQAAVLARSEQLSEALGTRELRMERFDVLSDQRSDPDDARGGQRPDQDARDADLADSRRQAEREGSLGAEHRPSSPTANGSSPVAGPNHGRDQNLEYGIDLRA